MTQETVTIENKTGIHARPASVFVQTATSSSPRSRSRQGQEGRCQEHSHADEHGLVQGTQMNIIAEGEDEADAVKALADLVNSKFGEE